MCLQDDVLFSQYLSKTKRLIIKCACPKIAVLKTSYNITDCHNYLQMLELLNVALFHFFLFFAENSSKGLCQKGLLVVLKLPCNNKNVCFSCRVSGMK